MTSHQILTVVGARPQFIKAAPVSRALRDVASEFLVHTGQHYDEGMSRVFFEELRIPEPDINLGIGSGNHGAQTGRMLAAIEDVLVSQDPGLVIVYGDTNSTLAGALAAAKLDIPVAHVEAGLRSYRRDMPEEINRVLTDHVSTLLFCPTENAAECLSREGITTGVEVVGDVMVDALQSVRERLTPAAAGYGIEGPYLVATLHRAENVDDADQLAAALRIFEECPYPVILPVHPRTAASMDRFDLRWPGTVTPVNPVGYIDMLSLVANANAVLTDSGGLQKESVLLGTRCVTLREETEWPETLHDGWNTVVGLDLAKALAAFDLPQPTEEIDAFGDGKAADRIAQSIAPFLER
jgi:UDP-GlcNAc3NAcA epimerase